MRDRLLCVTRFTCDNKGRRQRRNADTEIEQSVAMRRERIWIGLRVCVCDVGAGGVRGIGPVVFGLGVEVVRRAWTARAGKTGERGRGLREILRGAFEDAVVIDGCDVGVRGGLGLRLQKRRREEERSGLRAEGAAGSCHRERKSITMAERVFASRVPSRWRTDS